MSFHQWFPCSGMHTCLAILTQQESMSNRSTATELMDGWATLIVQIHFAYVSWTLPSLNTARRGQPHGACGKSCKKDATGRCAALFQYPRLFFRKYQATHLPYESRKAEKILYTVWSFCVFHISNSRQHAVYTEEQGNKYWVLISGRDCAGDLQFIFPTWRSHADSSRDHCPDLCPPPCKDEAVDYQRETAPPQINILLCAQKNENK